MKFLKRLFTRASSPAPERWIDTASDRVIHQRVRNRVMEELHGLADGDPAVRVTGAIEYFESFFDFTSTGREFSLQNDAMTPEEVEAVAEVWRLICEASDSTPKTMSDDDLIETGWPRRIAPVAARAYDVMARRGRFSEDDEEEIASEPAWPLSDVAIALRG